MSTLEKLKSLIAVSGLNKSQFARAVLGRDVRTLQRWLSEEQFITESAADFIDRIEYVQADRDSVQIRVKFRLDK